MHHLLEVQFHAGANEHLRVGIGAEHERVDLAAVQAVLEAETGGLAKRLEQLGVARHIAEEVGDTGGDASLGLGIMGNPFAQEVVLQIAQELYFALVGPHLLFAAYHRFELVQVLFESVLV